MRIAIVTERYSPDIGGLAVSVERAARLLVANGHRVSVIVPSDSLIPSSRPARTTPTELGKISIIRFGSHKRKEDTLAQWFQLIVEEHRRAPFDVLHAYFITSAAFVATYAGRCLKVPTVISARGNDLDRAIFDVTKSAHIVYALQNAGAITANSHELVSKAEALSGGRKVFYIPNGVDANHFRPERTANSGSRVIGFVGEARSKKGIATLLLAFREIHQDTGAELRLIGGVRKGEDADLISVFQKQNPSLPLEIVPYVPFEKMPAYYNSLDVLVMPSLADGMPNAVLEGMACELPVIATSVGGMKDILRHDHNAWLVPSSDSTALAHAIKTLLADKDLQRRLGSAARATVLEGFTREKELELNLNIYRLLTINSGIYSRL